MMNDGDWMCPDESCANINFARRLTCNRCSKERVDKASSKKLGTEIGKSAADKSRGLFSADDWQCSKCANVNWARRQTCNVCNAPKFGEVEARTGYGGGYNERGTVEYRPRHDSDEDEYDEFGRRKKHKTSHEKVEAADLQAALRPLSASRSRPIKRLRTSTDASTDKDRSSDRNLSNKASRNAEPQVSIPPNPSKCNGDEKKLNKVIKLDLNRQIPEKAERINVGKHVVDTNEGKEVNVAVVAAKQPVEDNMSVKSSDSIYRSNMAVIQNYRERKRNDVTHFNQSKPYYMQREEMAHPNKYLPRIDSLYHRRNVPSTTTRYNPSYEERKRSTDSFNSAEWQRNHPTRNANIIMSNMVSSTNDDRYRLMEQKRELSDVTYTLEERINLVLMTIKYENCLISAEKFRNTFNKRPPDVQTIFKWRQRFVKTGCLVDEHDRVRKSEDVSESRRKVVNGKFQWRKKRRYYKVAQENRDSSSSEENNVPEYSRIKLQSNGRIRRSENDLSTSENNVVRKEAVVINCESSEGKDDNENVCDIINDEEKSSSAGSDGEKNPSLKESIVVEELSRSSSALLQQPSVASQRSEFENDGSETPEITSARMDLARLEGAAKKQVFYEDDFFDEIETNKVDCKKETFRMPEVPVKKSVASLTTKNVKALEESTKNLFEDIVSESERYSSEGFESECEGNSQNNISVPEIAVEIAKAPELLKVECYEPIRRKSNETFEKVIDLPLPKFAKETVQILSVETTHLQPADICSREKNLTPALRRILQTMSSQVDGDLGKDGETIMEYVPTKIHPDLAKINQKMFKNTELNQDVWSEASGNDSPRIESTPTKAADLKESFVELKEIPVPAKPKNVDYFIDYCPDEDDLYKDSEEVCKSLLASPVKAKVDEAPVVKESISLLNFNFSSINAEDLVRALEKIKESDNKSSTESNNTTVNDENNGSVADDKMNESVVVEQKEVEEQTPPKKIPFLDDMFDPGSPPHKAVQSPMDNIAMEVVIPSKESLQDLDDLLDLPTKKPVVVGFKSFAIPKPIMLNRLRTLSQKKEAVNQASNKQNTEDESNAKKEKKKKTKRAAAKDDVKAVNSGKEGVVEEDEDEEESGDEGDLSKYDLWGSGDEDNGKDAEKETTTASAEPPSDPTKRTSPPPVSAATKRAASCGSGSASSRRSSSSSSSSSTSSPARNQPKNKYDDFNLNSEQSRAGSPEISPARYKAPKPERERHPRKSRSRSPITSKKDSGSSHRGNRSKEYIRRDSRDGRRRERDDRRHHASRSGEHSGRGSSNYGRGRAR